MMPSALTQRLIWKSLRQSVSLLVTLLLLVSIMSYITASLSRADVGTIASQMIILVPILFSVGAGAVLISFDRDAKAMDWLKSLPVRWYQVAFTPVVVATGLLVLLWFLVYLFYLSIRSPFGLDARDDYLPGMLYIASHSFYLLLCGFASAWIFRSPLPALLGIVPLAAIPAILQYGGQEFVHWFTGSSNLRHASDLPMPIAIGLLGVCGMGMVVGTAGLSRAVFLPETHDATGRGPKSFVLAAIDRLSSIADVFRRDAVQPAIPMARMSTVLWGFYSENRGIFRAGQVAVFVFAGCLVRLHQWSPLDRGHGIAAIIAFLSGIILLAIPVVTFQADANRDRVRFLTERGIRPRELWWSRQLITLGIVSLFLLVITLLGISNPQFIHREGSELDSWALLFVMVFNAYALSQWIGQVVHRVTLAIFISLVAVIFSSVWITSEKQSLWTVVASDIVLLIATYRMMLPWMERRIDWRYWLGHAKYAAIVTVLLVSPWMFQVFKRSASRFYPKLGDVTITWRDDWEREASAAYHESPPESVLSIRNSESDGTDWQNPPFLQIKDRQERAEAKLRLLEDAALFQREEFYKMLTAPLPPNARLHFNPSSIYSTSKLVSHGEKLRLEALHLPTLDSDLSPEAKYVLWVQLMVGITNGLRKSHHLFSQEIADQYEIWLIKQCLESETRRRIDDDTFDTICDLVGDPKKRWDARRRAFLVSEWNRRRGFEPNLYPNFSRTKNDYPAAAISPLIEYIEAAKLGRGKYPGEALAAISGLEPEHFGIGIGADWLRIDDARKDGFPLGVVLPVATLWGAGWEQQGEQLRKLAGDVESASRETVQ